VGMWGRKGPPYWRVSSGRRPPGARPSDLRRPQARNKRAWVRVGVSPQGGRLPDVRLQGGLGRRACKAEGHLRVEGGRPEWVAYGPANLRFPGASSSGPRWSDRELLGKNDPRGAVGGIAVHPEPVAFGRQFCRWDFKTGQKGRHRLFRRRRARAITLLCHFEPHRRELAETGTAK